MMNAIKKMCKGFLMRFAQEDKAGVRSQVKRLFTKAMEVEVHQEIPLLLSYDKKEGEWRNNGVHVRSTLVRRVIMPTHTSYTKIPDSKIDVK